jgi:hypothetical protein
MQAYHYLGSMPKISETLTAVGKKIPGFDAGISFGVKSQNLDGKRKL